VLRGIFGIKGDDVIGGWRRLRDVEVHSLCCPPRVTRMIKSRRMRWMEHVAYIGEMRSAYKILFGKL
jgi:hypothetical protein